jgi:flagellar biosynthetic protein FliR
VTIPIDQFLQGFSQFIWNFFRVSGFFMVVPIFGNQLVSPRIRIALSVATALAIAPLLGDVPAINQVDLGVFVDLGFQLMMGVGLGFATIVFFQLFVIAGQFIGMQMGLGFAAMVDPGNGVQVTVWSQFFLMLVTLSFLAMNGHLVLLEVLVRGFQMQPSGTDLSVPELAQYIASMGAWMFIGGVLLAIPAVVSLLISSRWVFRSAFCLA